MLNECDSQSRRHSGKLRSSSKPIWIDGSLAQLHEYNVVTSGELKLINVYE